MGSANRDGDVFESPDDYLIDRPRNRHLSFGYGIHFCIGAPLARMEARIAMQSLLTRAQDRFARRRPHATCRLASFAGFRRVVDLPQRLTFENVHAHRSVVPC